MSVTNILVLEKTINQHCIYCSKTINFYALIFIRIIKYKPLAYLYLIAEYLLLFPTNYKNKKSYLYTNTCNYGLN